MGIMQKLVLVFVLCCLVACAMARGTTRKPASGNRIRRVEVFTSDCFQCGMSALGKISVDIYGQAGKHCNTGLLDNVGKDDFNRGTISTFTGATIGQCNGYDLAKTKNEISMKITHSGSDGGKFNWVQVFRRPRPLGVFLQLKPRQQPVGNWTRVQV